jgi:hypothetical protein
VTKGIRRAILRWLCTERVMTKSIRRGDKVRAKTAAGVKMGKQPVNGSENQQRHVTGVLITGTVLKTRNITIDYDKWGNIYEGLGKVPFKEVYVKTDDGLEGWVGAGAVKKSCKSKAP